MSESEKKLREWMASHVGHVVTQLVDALLAETRQAARVAALEEAAPLTDERLDTYPSALGGDIRALKSQPARRYLDAEEVLRAIRETRQESADMLEADERDFLLDLDAPEVK